MAALAHLMQRLDRGHRRQQVIDRVAPRLLASSLLACVGVLAIRVALPAAEPLLPAVVATGLLAPLPWIPGAWRQRRAAAHVAAELDLLTDAEGTVMALAEQPTPAWDAQLAARLADVRLPPLRWRGLLPALAGVVLLVALTAVPQVVTPPASFSPAAALLAPLREELAQLAAAGVVTPEEQQELARRMAELVAQAEGPMLDQATWQGLDAVQARLEQQAVAAGERLAAALAAAQEHTAAPAVAPGDAAAAAQAAQLAEAMATSFAELAAQAPGLIPELKDPAAREALAQALAQAQAKGLLTEAQRAALTRAGLTQAKPGGPSTAAQSRALARSLAAELERRRQGLGQCRSASAAQSFLARLRQQDSANRWGLSRGPGVAPIEREPRDRTAGGSTQSLAPGVTLNPDGSVTVAAQAREAEPDEAARTALQRSAAQAFDPAAADSRRATVAPRHRAAVEAYFHHDGP
jgi:hypothetical protein